MTQQLHALRIHSRRCFHRSVTFWPALKPVTTVLQLLNMSVLQSFSTKTYRSNASRAFQLKGVTGVEAVVGQAQYR